MAAVAIDSPAGATAHSAEPSAWAQALALSRRAVVGIWRQPQAWIPSMAFPLLFAALNTAALGGSTHGISVNLWAQATHHTYPGGGIPPKALMEQVYKAVPHDARFHPFGPRDHFVDFLLVATLVQGVLFGSLNGASELAQDIESGFFDRLISTPVSRGSILVGRLAGSAALGFIQAVLFMGVFLLCGAHFAGGLAGALVLPIAAMFLAVGVGGVASAMAIKTGSVEAVQGSFPLLFISIFVSSAFFPTALMKGWYKAVATWNPLSLMINGLRHQALYGFDAGQAFKAIAIPAVISVLAIGLCLQALKGRLARQ